MKRKKINNFTIKFFIVLFYWFLHALVYCHVKQRYLNIECSLVYRGRVSRFLCTNTVTDIIILNCTSLF